MRTLGELIDQQDPALPLLNSWIHDPSGNGASLLVPDEALRVQTLLALQVTTRSMLGALAYETGGVSVAEGFVRLLGSGSKRSLFQTAALAGRPLGEQQPDVIIVGDDVLGGLFALNGGGFSREGLGQVFYLAADNRVWVSLGAGYTDFVAWCLKGDLQQLYGPLSGLAEYRARPCPSFDATYSFYPFLWSQEAKQGGVDVRTISADESLRLRLELCGFAIS